MSKSNQTDKPKKKLSSKFPHFYRFIPAKVNIKSYLSFLFIVLLLLGSGFLVLMNIVVSDKTPVYLKQLLQDPTNTKVLQTVLENNQEPALDAYLKNSLKTIGRQDLVNQIEQKNQQNENRMNKLKLLMKSYPQYPDGHAMLAVWYFNQGYCEEAKTEIEKAVKLDPNRPVLQKLESQISRCSI
jgi:tetratricopeptide (TPR) repeat protein